MSEALFPAFKFPNVRKLVVPDPGYEFFDIDLERAHLRICQRESNCGWIDQCFREGKRPYVELMKEYFRDPSMTKASKHYTAFKSICHGTNYLGQAAGVAPRVGM